MSKDQPSQISLEVHDQEAQITHVPIDTHIVDFDGPDDPENPTNWPRWKKVVTVVIVCALRLVPPLGTSMMAPASKNIQHDLRFQSEEAASFVVSAYVIGFGIGPMFLAPLSEIYGRNKIYKIGSFVFTAFTVGCALSQNLATLVACRFLAGLVGGAPTTNAGGTIADMIPIGRRGAILSLFSGVDVVAPVLGPTAGGYIAVELGWRWIFWLLSILNGTVCIACILLLQETYHPVILARKVNRLRKVTGNKELRAKERTTKPLKELLGGAVLRPIRVLMFSPIILALSLYMSFVYGLIYILFTTLSIVFQGMYGFDTGAAGLTFLGFGVGMVLALLVAGYFNDYIHNQLSRKHGEEKPEFVPTIAPRTYMHLSFDADRSHQVPPPVPNIWCTRSSYRAICVWVVGVLPRALDPSHYWYQLCWCLQVPTQAYIIDAFPRHCASALAANNLRSSTSGGTLPLAGPSLYENLGYGWGNSLLAFLSLSFGVLPIVFYRLRGLLGLVSGDEILSTV
ncbi:uncharacterized protein ATNIH1004_008009 [Aspergillus tanneri]|uniref:Major facilitator superfamily (MFS) profile domain-containing protein n=1 Tax=Aspergillus tanneri TaxID=1220188 RepID=A0A5M9MKZ0_9EURO|nr:uncharacterized protein ATNIH1004_008009 [Aspergillus tanneri]KAA8646576.1 hypothetical protein ATNIH1004_008009 [Aspergillus tanneri]